MMLAAFVVGYYIFSCVVLILLMEYGDWPHVVAAMDNGGASLGMRLVILYIAPAMATMILLPFLFRETTWKETKADLRYIVRGAFK